MGPLVRILSTFSAFVTLWLLPLGVLAEPRVHDGFMFRGAVGAGPTYLDLRFEYGKQHSGASLTGVSTGVELFVGGTPFAGLVLGAGAVFYEVKWSSGKVDGVKSSETRGASSALQSLQLFVDWYPRPTRGFYIHLGFGADLLGASNATTIMTSDSSIQKDNDVLYANIGAGYDFWIGDEWSIGPRITVQGFYVSGEFQVYTWHQNVVLPTLSFNIAYH